MHSLSAYTPWLGNCWAQNWPTLQDLRLLTQLLGPIGVEIEAKRVKVWREVTATEIRVLMVGENQFFSKVLPSRIGVRSPSAAYTIQLFVDLYMSNPVSVCWIRYSYYQEVMKSKLVFQTISHWDTTRTCANDYGGGGVRGSHFVAKDYGRCTKIREIV